MATKKTTTKSRTASATKKKAAPARSRAPKAASTSTRVRTKKAANVQSFRLAKQTTPFMTTSTSRETVYWLILGIVVIAFTAWIMKLQSDIQAIYDSIDTSNNAVLEIPSDHVNHKKSNK